LYGISIAHLPPILARSATRMAVRAARAPDRFARDTAHAGSAGVLDETAVSRCSMDVRRISTCSASKRNVADVKRARNIASHRDADHCARTNGERFIFNRRTAATPARERHVVDLPPRHARAPHSCCAARSAPHAA